MPVLEHRDNLGKTHGYFMILHFGNGLVKSFDRLVKSGCCGLFKKKGMIFMYSYSAGNAGLPAIVHWRSFAVQVVAKATRAPRSSINVSSRISLRHGSKQKLTNG